MAAEVSGKCHCFLCSEGYCFFSATARFESSVGNKLFLYNEARFCCLAQVTFMSSVVFKSVRGEATQYAVVVDGDNVYVQVLSIEKDAIWEQLSSVGFDKENMRLAATVVIDGFRHVRKAQGKRAPGYDLFRNSPDDEKFTTIGEHLQELLDANYLMYGGTTPAKKAKLSESGVKSVGKVWFESEEGKEFLKKLVKCELVLSEAGSLERVKEIFCHAVEVNNGVYPFGDADKLKLLDRKGVKV